MSRSFNLSSRHGHEKFTLPGAENTAGAGSAGGQQVLHYVCTPLHALISHLPNQAVLGANFYQNKTDFGEEEKKRFCDMDAKYFGQDKRQIIDSFVLD